MNKKPHHAPAANMAVDHKGNPLPFTPEEVRRIVVDSIDDGEILAVILRKDGDLMVQVLGRPSRALLDALESATKAYRRVLKGH